MRACRDGGTAIGQALRTLDRSYFAVLYRECRRVVADPELARDIVQETFIRVWRRCATFQSRSELLPWIRAIMRNAALDALRVDRREQSIDADDAMKPELERRIAQLSVERVPTAPDEAHAADVADCFARCWERFSREAPAHAAVIAWIAEDGLDAAEIAALIGRTPGATREFISQCRKRARVYLAEWYQLAFSVDAGS